MHPDLGEQVIMPNLPWIIGGGMLSSKNAQLRTELGSVKDRLETLERIATDPPSKPARDFEQLQ
ncbi:MAG TPA: hypothetical protein VGQ34_06855 [Sphingomicrobium sp.]|jgi:hypothetical protein|nr:hypothetical protein [Sphingomicrobium sp.]